MDGHVDAGQVHEPVHGVRVLGGRAQSLAVRERVRTLHARQDGGHEPRVDLALGQNVSTTVTTTRLPRVDLPLGLEIGGTIVYQCPRLGIVMRA